MSFSVKQRTMSHNVVRLAVFGDLDTAGGELLTEAIAEVMSAGPPAGLILDLDAVALLDARGIYAIERAHRLAANAGVAFVVVNTHNLIARWLLEDSGVLTAISRS